MAITTHPLVPIAMGTSDAGTEEGRAFHQSRLALYGKWLFLVSGAFLGSSRGPARLRHGLSMPAWCSTRCPRRRRTSLVAGARGFACSGDNARRRCGGDVADRRGLALMSLAYARRSLVAIGADPAPTAYIGILAVSYVLLARAIALPSTAGGRS